ncbi:hypothetical protein BDY24DRAFT_401858 [Mrakia frigida]|uniref:uncharacterized protein n=1 Tax=Mrakia frigida TaxID=29902 RepID=UPI003FCC0DB1
MRKGNIPSATPTRRRSLLQKLGFKKRISSSPSSQLQQADLQPFPIELPWDLFLEVFTFADSSTLASLSRVSYDFLVSTAPLLYRDVTLRSVREVELFFCDRKKAHEPSRIDFLLSLNTTRSHRHRLLPLLRLLSHCLPRPDRLPYLSPHPYSNSPNHPSIRSTLYPQTPPSSRPPSPRPSRSRIRRTRPPRMGQLALGARQGLTSLRVLDEASRDDHSRCLCHPPSLLHLSPFDGSRRVASVQARSRHSPLLVLPEPSRVYVEVREGAGDEIGGED